MAWTYDPDITTDRDKVRLLIGDTITTDQQLQDGEIAFFLSEESNVYRAAARACQSLAALYARKVDKAVGDLKISASQRQKAYAALAKDLWIKGGVSGIPSAGGVYVADKDSMADNDSIVHGQLRIGIHDYD
jgi:hypothetical protein